jgi:ribonuclease HI
MDDYIIAYCDGSSGNQKKKNNKCGIGIAFYRSHQFLDPRDGTTLIPKEKPFLVVNERIKDNSTNNEAEYIALTRLLEIAKESNYEHLIIYMDSALVVNQVNNKWKINYEHLKALKNKIDSLEVPFELFHVKREYNMEADKASKLLS